jgi:hypothetical protein
MRVLVFILFLECVLYTRILLDVVARVEAGASSRSATHKFPIIYGTEG